GGGTSTGGVFAASGAIGQHDAADVMTSGLFSLAGGFWSSVSVVPTPGPNLVISYSGSDIVISWPDTGSYTLQQNLDVAAAGWVASAYSITTLNGTNRITIPSPAGQLFFRLKQ
ncbi:MAG TPA: hypothetical protein VNT26_18180, partial [Candidatus Sulfotelmatobacter sp.]|nr:hypothetical protein [Candidatus Sulfotelmatobacter sp.]